MLYWIWLTQSRQIGAVAALRLLETFGSAEAIYRADALALSRAGVSRREILSLSDKSLETAEAIAERCEQAGVSVLTIRDEDYPDCLRAIADPPMVLYVRGSLPKLEERPTVGVVGSRKASAYGLTEARRIGYQIARCGGIVVTGLARGIDTQAAEGALTGQMPVIGVLGCGPDVIYPTENRTLYEDVAARGCLLSEYPPGTQPLSRNFPPRNRIISGLSDGVIVVEAAEKSGALITAEHALAQGRDVFVVPGNVNNPACAGSNRLLRESAMAITSGYDVVQEYQYRYPDLPLSPPEEDLPPCPPPSAQEPKQPLPLRPKVLSHREPIDVAALKPKLSKDEGCVLDCLTKGVQQVDEIINESQLPSARALTAITMLEIKGYITRMPGKYFRLADK